MCDFVVWKESFPKGIDNWVKEVTIFVNLHLRFAYKNRTTNGCSFSSYSFLNVLTSLAFQRKCQMFFSWAIKCFWTVLSYLSISQGLYSLYWLSLPTTGLRLVWLAHIFFPTACDFAQGRRSILDRCCQRLAEYLPKHRCSVNAYCIENFTLLDGSTDKQT